MVPTTPLALRIGKLYNRRPTTGWSVKEVKSYRNLVKAGFTMDDLKLIERYYAFERRKGDKGIYRRDLYTFLNNTMGELDRAKEWERTHPKRSTIVFQQPKWTELTDEQIEKNKLVIATEKGKLRETLRSLSAAVT